MMPLFQSAGAANCHNALQMQSRSPGRCDLPEDLGKVSVYGNRN